MRLLLDLLLAAVLAAVFAAGLLAMAAVIGVLW